MNELKNKSTILVIIALIAVCGGSFLGVKMLNDNVDAQTTAYSSTTMPSSATTAPVYQAYPTVPEQVMDLNVPSTKPLATTLPGGITTSGSAGLITTFAMVPGATTTTESTSALTLPTLPTDANAITTTRDLTTTNAADGTTKQNSRLEDKGIAGYLLDIDGKYFTTGADPWQRNFGYNEAFDTAAPFVSIFMDTMRCKFRYNNMDWMVQFWKGQYGLAFIGAEIGVYTKPLDRQVDHYDAASNEDALFMSMTGYRNDQPIFSREYTKYWWCTGFIPGQLENFSDRSELAVKCRITMKDSEMLSGFVTALKGNNLVEGRHYTVDGLDVFITWQ